MAKIFDLSSPSGTFGIAVQPAFASLEEFFRPTVIQALGNTLTPTQLRNAVFAAQAVQYDSDFLFKLILFRRGLADNRLVSGYGDSDMKRNFLNSLAISPPCAPSQ